MCVVWFVYVFVQRDSIDRTYRNYMCIFIWSEQKKNKDSCGSRVFRHGTIAMQWEKKSECAPLCFYVVGSTRFFLLLLFFVTLLTLLYASFVGYLFNLLFLHWVFIMLLSVLQNNKVHWNKQILCFCCFLLACLLVCFALLQSKNPFQMCLQFFLHLYIQFLGSM